MVLKELGGSDASVRTPGSLQFIGNSKLIAGYSDGALEAFDFQAMDQSAAANARKAADVASSLGIEIPSASVNSPERIRRWLMRVNQALTSTDRK